VTFIDAQGLRRLRTHSLQLRSRTVTTFGHRRSQGMQRRSSSDASNAPPKFVSLSWRIHFRSPLPPRRSQSSGAIVGLAQDYVGSNNINLLQTERAIRYQDPGWEGLCVGQVHPYRTISCHYENFRPEDAPVLEYRRTTVSRSNHILCSHHSDGPRQFVHRHWYRLQYVHPVVRSSGRPRQRALSEELQP
jgi:hypothetical protein